MSHTDLSPAAILTAATDLVRRRAARRGAEPVPAATLTLVLDEAAPLITDPAAHDLLTELLATAAPTASTSSTAAGFPASTPRSPH